MTLLIMAAGSGSRYGALKQFDELGPNKEFLFEFSISDALNNGFDHIVIVTKVQFVKDIKSYLQNRLPSNVKVDVIAQKVEDLPSSVTKIFDREKPWGTAHAVWVARNHIKNSFVVINADDFYGNDAFKKATEFIHTNNYESQFSLVAFSLKDTLSKYGTVSRGICNADNGIIKNIKEFTQIEKKESSIIDYDTDTTFTGNEPVSMNFWICNLSIFSEIESQFADFLNEESNIAKGEIYLPFVIQKMIDGKIISVKLTEASSLWFGVTYAEDKKNAVQILKKMTTNKIYPSPLWKN